MGSLDATKASATRRNRRADGPFSTKLTAEIIVQLCEVIASAVPMDTAAAYVGISKQTMYSWMRQSRDIQHHVEAGNHGPWPEYDSLLLDFANGLDKAVAAWEVTALGRVTAAAAEHWQAAGWLLERRKPDEYGRRQRIDMGNADGQPFRMAQTPMFDPSLLTDDELETVVRLLRKAQPGGDVIEMVPRRELTA